MNRRISVENIQQVEIIRGPGSALYGASAFSGVVNIVTIEDANSASIFAGAERRLDGSVNVHGKYGSGHAQILGEHFALSASAENLTDEQYRGVSDYMPSGVPAWDRKFYFGFHME